MKIFIELSQFFYKFLIMSSLTFLNLKKNPLLGVLEAKISNLIFFQTCLTTKQNDSIRRRLIFVNIIQDKKHHWNLLLAF